MRQKDIVSQHIGSMLCRSDISVTDTAMLEDWTIYSWYCPNCRNEVAGLKNSKNQIRVKCKTCGSEMVRTIVGRRHDVIDIYAPSGQEHNDLELRRY